MALTSFRQAATRHYRDAEYLHDAGHLANADHLSGFAAECAIKGLVVDHLGGYLLDGFPFTGADKKLNHHVGSRLWSTVGSLAVGHQDPELLRLFEDDPFDDWQVSDRYTEGVHISAQTVQKHLEAARRAIIALEAATLSMNDGGR